ncbi:MAG: hypothetical protein ACAI44_39720 [Candidatus Sericytochromatia bacterium]
MLSISPMVEPRPCQPITLASTRLQDLSKCMISLSGTVIRPPATAVAQLTKNSQKRAFPRLPLSRLSARVRDTEK